jgi:peptidoglycan glycosyltransferase
MVSENAFKTSGREAYLLGFGTAFVLVNYATLILIPRGFILSPLVLLSWAICAWGGHFVLRKLVPGHDPYIWPVTMLLSGWGLLLVARLAPPFSERQAIWLALSSGMAVVVASSPNDLRILRRYRYLWLIAGLVLLGTTLIFGVNPSGTPDSPRLWLNLGAAYFQPSEILKLLLIVFLASYLADKREALIDTQVRVGRWAFPSLPYFAPMLLMWGFCMVLLTWQRDLGAASLFFLIFLIMLFVSTGRPEYFVVGGGLLGLAGVAGYLLYGVVRLRVDTWWDPWPEASDRAFQIVQSLLAVAAGGVMGQGLGQGAPVFVPVVHSDFVFAAIGEEYGLIGTTAVSILLVVLVLRSLRIALNNEARAFRVLLSAGIGVAIGVQSLLIMAGVLKLVPLTGVTLPFLSYGGSSLASTFIMIGLLIRLSVPSAGPDSNSMLHDTDWNEWGP